MSHIYLYNTLSRKNEEFKPLIDGEAGVYTCGPTVYNFAHIGNLRTYLFEDFLIRVLKYNDYKVKRVMNITDVGHLTGDMDMGEDKMELGAAREGKSAWEIAEFYTQAFKRDLQALNILEPDVWVKVTDCIPEQITLVKILEEKGYTYKTSDGIYFDTTKFPEYNKLSHLDLDELKEGARVEKNDEKKNPTDFALWKLSPLGTKRQMEWDSPWGKGFPGWHIECSAISAKELGDQLDIHCGGIDHINIHHTNEIAQSEAASGKKFFNYWLHGAFLNIAGGKKMAKSDGDFLTVQNALMDRGINPLAYRFSALQVGYHKPMEYSLEGLKQAEEGLKSLYKQIKTLAKHVGQEEIDKAEVSEIFKLKFLAAINDDLNMPQAMAVLFSVFKSEIAVAEKLKTIFDFDKVLGLGLETSVKEKDLEIPAKVKVLAEKRLEARINKDWAMSDKLRDEAETLGYIIEDVKEDDVSYRIKKK